MTDERKSWTEPELKQQATGATEFSTGAPSDAVLPEPSGGSIG